MTLAETISQNMKVAMKAKDNATLSTLRLLLSAIKNKQIDVGHVLSDSEIQDVVKTQVKQLKDAVDSFTQGGREDMAQASAAEIQVLEQFLPAQMSDEELTQILKRVVESSGAQSKADIGKVMGSAMQAVAGRADGSRVKTIVQSLLPVLILVVFGAMSANHETVAAIPLLDTLSNGTQYTELLLRLFRVLVLWLGIPAITMILTGGFEYTTASYRDEVHHHSLSKLTFGVFATLIIAALFAFCTIILQQIQ
ncbi:GatB/YqeY domain-containing protein [Candidatus Uhrbacteria bacterium]|nr:GatB/YqeY domain-containing protein [Candidatus Uhrbacteria bacterium]